MSHFDRLPMESPVLEDAAWVCQRAEYVQIVPEAVQPAALRIATALRRAPRQRNHWSEQVWHPTGDRDGDVDW